VASKTFHSGKVGLLRLVLAAPLILGHGISLAPAVAEVLQLQRSRHSRTAPTRPGALRGPSARRRGHQEGRQPPRVALVSDRLVASAAVKASHGGEAQAPQGLCLWRLPGSVAIRALRRRRRQRTLRLQAVPARPGALRVRGARRRRHRDVRQPPRRRLGPRRRPGAGQARRQRGPKDVPREALIPQALPIGLGDVPLEMLRPGVGHRGDAARVDEVTGEPPSADSSGEAGSTPGTRRTPTRAPRRPTTTASSPWPPTSPRCWTG